MRMRVKVRIRVRVRVTYVEREGLAEHLAALCERLFIRHHLVNGVTRRRS